MELICFLTKSTHDQRHLKPCHHRLDNIKLDPCWKDFSFSEPPGAKHTKGRGKSRCGKCPKAGLVIVSKRAAPSAPSNPCCAALWPEATQKPHRDIRGSLEILRCSGRSQVRTRLIPHPVEVVLHPRHTEGWRLGGAHGGACYLQTESACSCVCLGNSTLKKPPNSMGMSLGGSQFLPTVLSLCH